MPATSSSFADLGLRPLVVHALRRLGVETPFPIQTAVIPDALAGYDVLGRAPTGSGKTLAFGLPLLHRLSGATSSPGRPRGLVLAPTRELALQIESALEEPALSYGLRIASVIGGVPLKRQVDRLRRGIDIVVATPGRLQDLISADAIAMTAVTITVVDEADRMADLGFLPQVEALLDRTPNDGQRMLFSATLDGDVDTLVARYLRSPAEHHAAAPPVDSAPVIHHFFRVSPQEKSTVAAAITAREGRTMVFLRTKHAVDRFTDALVAEGISASALHGDKSQANRTRTLAAFANGSVPVLVATDVVARGIHVDDVSLVLHVDPPADAKDYTHRAGRTARAGAGGIVVTLVTESQVSEVAALSEAAHIDVELVDVGPSSALLSSATGARKPPGRPLADTTDPAGTPTAPKATNRRRTDTHTSRTRSRRSRRR